MDFEDLKKRVERIGGIGLANSITPESYNDYLDFVSANKKEQENQKDLADYQRASAGETESNSFLTPEQQQTIALLTEQRLKEARERKEGPKPFSPPTPFVQKENYEQGDEVFPLFMGNPTLEDAPKINPNPNFNPALVEKPVENSASKSNYEDLMRQYYMLGQNATGLPLSDSKQAELVAPLRLPGDPLPESNQTLDRSINSLPVSPKIQDNDKFVLDVGNNSITSLENLLAAQEAANSGRTAANVSRGLDQVSAGIASLGAGVQIKPTGQEMFKDLAAQADQPVKDYAQAVEMEKRDPNSPISKAFQQYAKKLGVDIKGQLSAADGEKILPFIFKGFEAQENRKARKEELALRLQEMNQRYALMREDRQRLKEEKNELRTHDWISSKNDKLTNSKEYQNMIKLRGANERIAKIVMNPNAVGDVAALYEFITALDPESTVREGEIQLGKEALGIFGKLSTKISQASKDPRLLTNDFLKKIQERVNHSYKLMEENYKDRRNAAFEEAKARGVDESRFGELDPLWGREKPQRELNNKAGKQVVKKGYNSKTNQTQLIYSDGSKEIVDGKR